MPFGVGHWELIALVLVALLLFGSSQLPRIGRQLGRGVREAGREIAEVKTALDPQAPADEQAEKPQR
ncbi:MAG: twin-arginine translocase TatA/TatE family subunit [Gaiellaceae bacterium]